MIDTDLGCSIAGLSILLYRDHQYIGAIPIPENRAEIPGILLQQGVAADDLDRQVAVLNRMLDLAEIADSNTEREPW